jgi:signal transduction histidine kinase
LSGPAVVPSVEDVTNIWPALTRPRFLLSAWPWRGLAYLTTTVAVGLLALLAFVTLTGVGVVTAIFLVGLAVLAAVLLLGIPVGALERLRLRLIDPVPLPNPVRGGPRRWVRQPATWRELGYAVLLAVVLWPLDLAVLGAGVLGPALVATPLWLGRGDMDFVVAGPWMFDERAEAWPLVPIGLLLTVAWLYVVSVVASAQATVARYLLTPGATESLAARLSEVDRSRTRIVDSFAAERLRIERDLHDGAQQRLVALTMNLGEARLQTAPDAPAAAPLARAQEQADHALAELRELIRNVHPKVLSDHGLTAALVDVAERATTPVRVDVTLDRRLPAAVESAAYFAVCEALTNVDRHSGATGATLSCRLADEGLVVEIRDDGVGGADPAGGTGLTGLADRLAALGGQVTIDSAAGGPTVVTMWIPC